MNELDDSSHGTRKVTKGAAGAHAAPSEKYKFVFTSVRRPGSVLQIQEVQLYGLNDVLLQILSATNPLGDTPIQHPPSNAVDGTVSGRGSKWLDMNMATLGSSTLLLTLSAPKTLSAYELWTANDNPSRDPTSWLVYAWSNDAWRLLQAVAGVDAPTSRFTSYGRIRLGADSASAASPSAAAFDDGSSAQQLVGGEAQAALSPLSVIGMQPAGGTSDSQGSRGSIFNVVVAESPAEAEKALNDMANGRTHDRQTVHDDGADGGTTASWSTSGAGTRPPPPPMRASGSTADQPASQANVAGDSLLLPIARKDLTTFEQSMLLPPPTTWTTPSPPASWSRAAFCVTCPPVLPPPPVSLAMSPRAPPWLRPSVPPPPASSSTAASAVEAVALSSSGLPPHLPPGKALFSETQPEAASRLPCCRATNLRSPPLLVPENASVPTNASFLEGSATSGDSAYHSSASPVLSSSGASGILSSLPGLGKAADRLAGAAAPLLGSLRDAERAAEQAARRTFELSQGTPRLVAAIAASASVVCACSLALLILVCRRRCRAERSSRRRRCNGHHSFSPHRYGKASASLSLGEPGDDSTATLADRRMRHRRDLIGFQHQLSSSASDLGVVVDGSEANDDEASVGSLISSDDEDLDDADDYTDGDEEKVALRRRLRDRRLGASAVKIGQVARRGEQRGFRFGIGSAYNAAGYTELRSADASFEPDAAESSNIEGSMPIEAPAASTAFEAAAPIHPAVQQGSGAATEPFFDAAQAPFAGPDQSRAPCPPARLPPPLPHSVAPMPPAPLPHQPPPHAVPWPLHHPASHQFLRHSQHQQHFAAHMVQSQYQPMYDGLAPTFARVMSPQCTSALFVDSQPFCAQRPPHHFTPAELPPGCMWAWPSAQSTAASESHNRIPPAAPESCAMPQQLREHLHVSGDTQHRRPTATPRESVGPMPNTCDGSTTTCESELTGAPKGDAPSVAREKEAPAKHKDGQRQPALSAVEDKVAAVLRVMGQLEQRVAGVMERVIAAGGRSAAAAEPDVDAEAAALAEYRAAAEMVETALRAGDKVETEQLRSREVALVQLSDADLKSEYERYTAVYLDEAAPSLLRGGAEMMLIKIGELMDKPRQQRIAMFNKREDEQRAAMAAQTEAAEGEARASAERQRQATANADAFAAVTAELREALALAAAQSAQREAGCGAACSSCNTPGGDGSAHDADASEAAGASTAFASDRVSREAVAQGAALARRIRSRPELRLLLLAPEEVRRMPQASFQAMGTGGLRPLELRAVLHALKQANVSGAAGGRLVDALATRVATLPPLSHACGCGSDDSDRLGVKEAAGSTTSEAVALQMNGAVPSAPSAGSTEGCRVVTCSGPEPATASAPVMNRREEVCCVSELTMPFAEAPAAASTSPMHVPSPRPPWPAPSIQLAPKPLPPPRVDTDSVSPPPPPPPLPTSSPELSQPTSSPELSQPFLKSSRAADVDLKSDLLSAIQGNPQSRLRRTVAAKPLP